jgi:hypothetical protein
LKIVFSPYAGGTVTGAPVQERYPVKLVHRASIMGAESNMAAVPRERGIAVERTNDVE